MNTSPADAKSQLLISLSQSASSPVATAQANHRTSTSTNNEIVPVSPVTTSHPLPAISSPLLVDKPSLEALKADHRPGNEQPQRPGKKLNYAFVHSEGKDINQLQDSKPKFTSAVSVENEKQQLSPVKFKSQNLYRGTEVSEEKLSDKSSAQKVNRSRSLKILLEPEDVTRSDLSYIEREKAFQEDIYSSYQNDQVLSGRDKGPSRSIYPFYPNYNKYDNSYTEYRSDTSEEPQSDYASTRAAINMLGTCSLTHTTRSFSVSGQSCIITPQVLQAQDGESVDLDLVYVIKEVTSGSVVLVEGRSRQVVSNFTQRQINNGDVLFQHKYTQGASHYKVFISRYRLLYRS